MDNGLTGLIGLSRKAGKVEVGEESVSAAAKAHKARIILLASDAGEHTRRRGELLGEQGNCPALPLPLTKAELGGALGRGSCAILALTDVGMAASLVKKLEAMDPALYGPAAQRLDHKAEKTLRRRRETRQREKAAKAAGRKPWAAPPRQGKKCPPVLPLFSCKKTLF